MLRIIIAGGRDFNDRDAIIDALQPLTKHLKAGQVQIVTGGARGADALGAQIATLYGCNHALFPAQWDDYGKPAGYIRNELMAENADVLIACWDGKSRGTKHMIGVAKLKGLDVVMVHY